MIKACTQLGKSTFVYTATAAPVKLFFFKRGTGIRDDAYIPYTHLTWMFVRITSYWYESGLEVRINSMSVCLSLSVS